MSIEIDLRPGIQTENWFQAPRREQGDSQRVPFLCFVPRDYQPTRKLPLLLFLHGYGECGDGDFHLLKTHGPPKLVDSNPDFPFITVSPQCPTCDETMNDIIENWDEQTLISLLDHVIDRAAVDTERVYVTGLSMGGFGAWRLVASNPTRFAALLPVCGGGNVDWANQLVQIPTWAFHGANDEMVGLQEFGKPMVDALQSAGGNVKLTVYPDAGHDSWTRTYENQEIYNWLLRQRRHVQ